jgi:RNA polymerase sigma-70 factor (ECF subfamily)
MDNNFDFSSKSDEELVKDALTNRDDFLYIVKRYKDKLFSYARRISNVRFEEIDDLLQNIFIKVYLNLNDYNHDLKFSSWIYRIAHNEIIDNYRKTKARPQTIELNPEYDYLKNLKSEFNLIDEIDQKLSADKITAIINSLEEKLKEIIFLRFFADKDYFEISDILKIPAGTVASRLNKAKAELKKKLTKI